MKLVDKVFIDMNQRSLNGLDINEEIIMDCFLKYEKIDRVEAALKQQISATLKKFQNKNVIL